MWLSVNADVPDSVPFITICLYDTLESIDATVKKWSTSLGTFIVLTQAECKDRKLWRFINPVVFEMSARGPLYATAAIGRPQVHVRVQQQQPDL